MIYNIKDIGIRKSEFVAKDSISFQGNLNMTLYRLASKVLTGVMSDFIRGLLLS